ncbi:MAG: MauE/DoxX family redox-associated membrane protein [Desulfobaccales bacterium]
MPPHLKAIVRRLLEMILGAIFVYAGYLKLVHTEEFAEAVLAYQLLPPDLVGLVAAVLPVLEVAAGLLLALKLKRRSCLMLLGLLSGIFLVAMFIALARGLKIDCGCGLFFSRQVGLAPMLEDGLMIVWAAGLYYWELRAAATGPALAAAAGPDLGAELQ